MAKSREVPAKSELGKWIAVHRGNLSVRKVAARAEISEGRWRQVEAGYASAGGGVQIPVNPKAETVAAMARAVGGDVAEALGLAGYRPADHPELLAETGVGDEVRDAIEQAPKLGPEGRERVLNVYDFEVARETRLKNTG